MKLRAADQYQETLREDRHGIHHESFAEDSDDNRMLFDAEATEHERLIELPRRMSTPLPVKAYYPTLNSARGIGWEGLTASLS